MTLINDEITDDSLFIDGHNFTKIAWGKVGKDNSKSDFINFEKGIILPTKKSSSKA